MPDVPQNSELTPTGNEGVLALGGALRLCFRLLVLALVVLAVAGLVRCVVIVKQHQVGVVYRFGKVQKVLTAGQHGLVLPRPLEEVKLYTVTREQQIDSDAFMYAQTAEEKRGGRLATLPPTLQPGLDGFLVTGDSNIVHCEAKLYFVVVDPLKYYEGLTEGPALLRSLLNDSLVTTSAEVDLNEALLDIGSFTDRVRQTLRRQLSLLDPGIEVSRLVLKVFPPRQVKEAFNAHTAVAQEVDQQIKSAKSYRDTVLNETESKATLLLAQARAQKSRRIESAQARAENFAKLAEEYHRNPEIILRELYVETLRRILGQAEEKYVVSPQNQRQIRVLLKRASEKSTTAQKGLEP
jgi:regulator of protease activity HflC (stomatin/prohibitin superfamily)